MELKRKTIRKDREQYYFTFENFNNCNTLEVDIYYSKGGENYWRSCQEKRGYYISLQPCIINDVSIISVPTDGIKMCIKEVGRKSRKGLDTAVNSISVDNIINMARYNAYPISKKEIEKLLKIIKEREIN